MGNSESILHSPVSVINPQLLEKPPASQFERSGSHGQPLEKSLAIGTDPQGGQRPEIGGLLPGMNASMDGSFTLIGGTYTALPNYSGAAPGKTFAVGINSAGDIVGWYNDSNGVSHGFLLSGGTYTLLAKVNPLCLNPRVCDRLAFAWCPP
jgi:probable HAF family extracellular repeat protein